VDTAVTVLGLLGLAAPRDAIGHPLTEPFETPAG
jgi:hypothetical protein